MAIFPTSRSRSSTMVAALALLAACGGSDKPKNDPGTGGPSLVSATPNHGALGTLVVLAGTGLDADPATIQVSFKSPAQGTITVAPVSASTGSLRVLVPSAIGEAAQLTVTVGGRTSAPIPFTIEPLADPTPGGVSETASFFAGLDATLASLGLLLDGKLAPLLEQSGQVTEAASIRAGLLQLRPALSAAIASKLAAGTPEQLALFDGIFASSGVAEVLAELAAIDAAFAAAPAPASRFSGISRAAVGASMLGGFDSGSVEDIKSVRRFLSRAYDLMDKLDWALIGAIAAAGTASAVPGFQSAAALIPILEEIRETLVKPILRILEAVIPLMGSFPTQAVGGSLRIQITDNPIYVDQGFGSMASPYPPTDTGAVLILEPYGVKGYMSFQNDGGESLREVGADLAPDLSGVAAALLELSGFDVGALEVTDVEAKLKLLTDRPDLFHGAWSEPVFWITATAPGLAQVTLQVDLTEVAESCPIGMFIQCIPADQVRITRPMQAVAGTEAGEPFTQGARVDTAQVEGRPAATGHLGDTLVITGEGFSRDAQLAPQDVYFEPAPGYPLSGVAGSPQQSLNDYDDFRTVIPDALPGPMTVHVAGHPSNVVDFTILPPRLDPPPPSGIVGEFWTLTGEGFSGAYPHNEADWAGFRSSPEAGGHRQLELTVPDGALSGPFKVVTLGVLESETYGVIARRFSEPSALSALGRSGLRPAVARDGSTGARIVAWIDRNAKGSAQLVATVLPAGAASAGTPVVLPASPGGHPGAPAKPAVAAADGWFFVAWVERGPDRILLSRSQNGTDWSFPVAISSHAGPARQPALAADGPRVIAAWLDEPASVGGAATLRFRLSADAGGSFGGAYTWSGGADASDPAVALAGDAIAIAWCNQAASGRALVAIRSQDAGATFEPAWSWSLPGGAARHPAVALGPSCVEPGVASVYLAWEQSGADMAEDVFFARADLTASGATNVTQTPAHSQSPALAVDADCVPALAWIELGRSRAALLSAGVAGTLTPLPAEIRFARSFDGGDTFNPRPMTLAKLLDGSRLGHLAMAGGGSALLDVAWQEDFGGPPVVAFRTTDGLGGSPATQPPGPAGEASADLVLRSHQGDLWASAPDGANPMRLTRGFGTTGAPAPSPDGRFLSWLPGADQTIVAEADGSHPLRVTATADFVWRGTPHWSPHGGFLAVASPYAPPTLGWVLPDSRGLTIVGTSVGSASVIGFTGSQPWSPEGHLVLSDRDVLRQFDPASGFVGNLPIALPAGTFAYYPSWSPDGGRLALVVTPLDHVLWPQGSIGTGDLYLYDVVGGALTQLTDSGQDSMPTWSPDGKMIAFVRGIGAPHQVHVQAVDAPPGSDVNVTADLLQFDDTEPVFLPDGSGVIVSRRASVDGSVTTVAIDVASYAVTPLSGHLAGGAAVLHLGERPAWAADASATVGVTGTTSASVSWSGASDDVGVDHYLLYDGATLVATVAGGATTETVAGLDPGTTYTLTVYACDAAGNCTLSGPTVTFTTQVAGGAAPTWSLVPPVLGRGPAHSPGGYDSPYDLYLAWTQANESGIEYRVYLNGSASPVKIFREWDWQGGQVTGLRPSTSYDFQVQACFLSGGCTTDGPMVTLTTLPDTSPPMFQGGSVEGAFLSLDYSEPLDPASTPSPADFEVFTLDAIGDPVPLSVATVTVFEGLKRVVLTLPGPVYAGEPLAVAYTPGASPIRNTGGVDADPFITTYVSNQSWLRPSAVAPDGAGGLLVVGGFRGHARLGAHPMAESAFGSGFVARRSAAGQWLWAVPFAGPNGSSLGSIAASPDGGAVIAGNFAGSVTLPKAGGDLVLTANGVADAVVAKLDSGGAWLWATRIGSDDPGGSSLDTADGVTVGASGDVFASGSFGATATFGGPTLSRTSTGYADQWVARLDGAGAWQWVSTAGSANGDDAARAVATDGTSVWITGSYGGIWSATGIADSLINTGYGFVLAKLDVDGTWLWGRDGSLLAGNGYALVPDGGGGVYAAGVSAFVSMYGLSPRPWISRWDGAGDVTWSATGTSPGNGMVAGLHLDPGGDLYATGQFSGSLDLGGKSMTGNSGSDVFVARLAPSDGSATWLLPSGNSGGVWLAPAGIAPCGTGAFCVVGTADPGTTSNPTPFWFGALTASALGQVPFVAAAANTADVPPVGAWTALGGMED